MGRKDYGVSADIGSNITKILLLLIIIAIIVVGGIFGVAYFQEQSRISEIESRNRAETNEIARHEKAEEEIYLRLNSSKLNKLCSSWSSGDYNKIDSESKWKEVDYYLEEDSRGYVADIDFYAYGESRGGRGFLYAYSAKIRFTKNGSLDTCLSIKYLDRHKKQ